MAIRVECCAGFRGDQEPCAFWLGEHRRAVLEIDDRWIEPGRRWFRVCADDGDTYILRYDAETDAWDIAAFRKGR